MVQAVVGDGIIEQYDKAMPKKHWLRNKKQQINYNYDTPFATERQLEDQRLLQERNRNPQALVPTKVDKVRSEVIIAKKGASRAVAIKANVLNKIVREASGVYNYTIVAPPREKMSKDSDTEEKFDPYTHPKLKAYAAETKSIPVIVSFGHRPRSASRTFHPSTMKFRLKHGEIVAAGSPSKHGIGLPVNILSKVLYAPKIEKDFLSVESDEESFKVDKNNVKTVNLENDYNNLFFTAEEEKDIFNTTVKKIIKEENNLTVGSWISSIEHHDNNLKRKNSNIKKLKPLINISDDRPDWNQGFHTITMTNKERYALKESRLLKGQVLPIKDRLTRFISKSGGVLSANDSFCQLKIETDKKLQAGENPDQFQKLVPKKNETLLYDPYNPQLREIQKRFKESEKIRLDQIKAKEYHDSLFEIPNINYFPTSELAKMKSPKKLKTKKINKENIENCDNNDSANNIDDDNNNNNNNEVNEEDQQKLIAELQYLEKGYKAALKAAHRGDTTALYNFNMKINDEEQAALIQSSSR